MHIITIGNNGEIKLGHKLVHNYLISELFSEGPAEVATSAGKQTRNKWFPPKHATHMRIAFCMISFLRSHLARELKGWERLEGKPFSLRAPKKDWAYHVGGKGQNKIMWWMKLGMNAKRRAPATTGVEKTGIFTIPGLCRKRHPLHKGEVERQSRALRCSESLAQCLDEKPCEAMHCVAADAVVGCCNRS